MRDSEIRGKLLTVLYDLRRSNGGWVPISDGNFSGGEPIDLQTIGTVCEHMAQAGLIEFKPLRDGTGYAAGMAKITGHGVDVMEQTKAARIETALKTAVSNATVAPDALHVVDVSKTGDSPQSTTVTRTGPISGTLSEAISSTIYPDDPSGQILVHNAVSVNPQGVEFGFFNEKIDELIAELRKSNLISGEVREKLIAEISMGVTLIMSPKPDRRLIDLLLKRPLVYLVDKAGSAVIGALASAAALALAKLMGVF